MTYINTANLSILYNHPNLWHNLPLATALNTSICIDFVITFGS